MSNKGGIVDVVVELVSKKERGIIRVLCGVLATIIVGVVAWFIFVAVVFIPVRLRSYAAHISLDPETYANVEAVTFEEFGIRTYAFERNQFINILDGKISPPGVADDEGRLPVLKFDGDIFIVLRKWVNDSGGLAISDDPTFKSKIETLDCCFRICHVRGNVYTWDNDLERPQPD